MVRLIVSELRGLAVERRSCPFPFWLLGTEFGASLTLGPRRSGVVSNALDPGLDPREVEVELGFGFDLISGLEELEPDELELGGIDMPKLGLSSFKYQVRVLAASILV